jgi:hypothetical protein
VTDPEEDIAEDGLRRIQEAVDALPPATEADLRRLIDALNAHDDEGLARLLGFDP